MIYHEIATKDSVHDLIFQAPMMPEAKPFVENIINAASQTWLLKANGKLAGAIGLRAETLISTEAYIWLYHVPEIWVEMPIGMVRWSKRFIDSLPFSALYGHTAAFSSVCWLRWLGAEITSEGRVMTFVIRKPIHD